MSELRWHPFLQQWVITATWRQDRTYKPPRDYCPLCPTRPGHTPTEVPAPDYDIVVFENRFPSLRPDAPEPAVAPTALSPVRRAQGVCEVVLYTSRHEGSLAHAPLKQIYHLVQVWADRYRELASRPEVEYVFIFENKGDVVGVTLSHPHGQIYAYPFLPPVPAKELQASAQHWQSQGECLLCGVLQQEVAEGRRIVAENPDFVAFIPFFARYPYEVWIVPRRHRPHLASLTREEGLSLAQILQVLLHKYDNLFGFSFPYIMAMHQAPAAAYRHQNAGLPDPQLDYTHFHIEFYPPHRTADKLKYLAGSESGAGVFINDTLAEEKAAELRAASSAEPPLWPAGGQKARGGAASPPPEQARAAAARGAEAVGGAAGTGEGGGVVDPELAELVGGAKELFRQHFGSPAGAGPEDLWVAAAPGRVNLIGEHTDYNEGFVLPMAINRWLVLVARPRRDNQVVAWASAFQEEAAFEVGRQIPPAQPGSWSNYVRGTLQLLFAALVDRGQAGSPAAGWGFDLAIHGNIPVGSGLSSSAALEMGVATLAQEMWVRRGQAASGLSRPELALLARQAENQYAGVACGIMDQFAVAMGERAAALFLDCRDLSFRSVPLPASGYRWTLCDSAGRRELAVSAYNQRRDECARAVEALRRRGQKVQALRDVTPAQLLAAEGSMDGILFQRARHVVEEDQRVLQSVDALARGDWEQFGRLMTASHASLRDLYEVSSKDLDQLVDLALTVPGVLGARLTGAGFGGFMVALVREEAVQPLLERLGERFYGPRGLATGDRTLVCRPVEGAALLEAGRPREWAQPGSRCAAGK